MVGNYEVEALVRLKFDFPRLSVQIIKKALNHYGKKYVPAFELLSQIDSLEGSEDGICEEISAIAPFKTSNISILLRSNRPSDYIKELQKNDSLKKEIEQVHAATKKRKLPWPAPWPAVASAPMSRASPIDLTSKSIKKAPPAIKKTLPVASLPLSTAVDFSSLKKPAMASTPKARGAAVGVTSPEFTLECLVCSVQFTFGDGFQCSDGHTFCRGCYSIDCRLCVPAPKEAELECACCYGEYPFEEMISCSEGCLFCGQCLKTFVQTELFTNNKSNIACISSNECSGNFPMSMFEKALSPRLVKNLQKHRYQSEIATFGAQYWKCPHCANLADVAEDLKVVKCPDPDCQKESCRMCREDPHGDLSCVDAKAAKEEKQKTDARSKLADEMTAKVTRTCPDPRCDRNTLIMKNGGCNHMQCPCGAHFCYICRKQLPAKNYKEHFCGTPHCDHSSCGMCVLFVDPSVKDDEARRELAAAHPELGLLSPQKVAGN